MDERELAEKVLSKETVFLGVILNLEHWQVELPDGSHALREVACLKGASGVLAVDDEGQVILVRQARPAVGRVTMELPAGKLNTMDEDPLECAKRELSEETGLEAAHWQKLMALEPTPAFCNEKLHLYMATGLTQAAAHPDEGEFVSVVRMPLAKAVELVMNGEIRDGKTCVALLMGARLLPDLCRGGC